MTGNLEMSDPGRWNHGVCSLNHLSPLLPSTRAAASKAQAEHPSAFSGLYLPHLPFHRNSPPSAATVHGVLSRAAASWRELPWEAHDLVGEPSIS